MIRIAINGCGRIGRGVIRAWLTRKELQEQIEIVALNDLMPLSTIAWLLQSDSVYGRLDAEVVATNGKLKIGEIDIPVFAERDPQLLPWKNLNVDVVLEATGFFTKAVDAQKRGGR